MMRVNEGDPCTDLSLTKTYRGSPLDQGCSVRSRGHKAFQSYHQSAYKAAISLHAPPIHRLRAWRGNGAEDRPALPAAAAARLLPQ